ncbi:transcriptional regulator [Mycolicibacter minnesotensis]|uniref:Transcriptional regulator n=1 Tax=Mycolicibacter minnesotensis TaxID=1118379 RepID=A0A7I7R425_9MYCO|nr:helix-turn-helix domain-containing protein [Mycolicibacter minnesotensis]ORB01080.1 transcriptional regulator [Mycolicibacter minnesotensis]BBY33383.1 Fis family transcriptional regulator [Mycolicibacter minnesotensis]
MAGDDNPLLRVGADRVASPEPGGPIAAGVSEVIIASWERSRDAGVDVVRPISTYSDEIDTDSLLARCARPVMDQLRDDISTSELPLAVGLTDRRVRVVARVDSCAAATPLFDRVQYAPGFDFSESAVGTNGAGTVFESGQAVSIVGPEHYSESLTSFAAGGAPILDPVTGRVEGVVAIATLADAWSPAMQALVKTAAREIGRNLLLDRGQAQQAVFEAYLRVTARSARAAVFAFGAALQIANPAAQQMFDAGEQQVLRDHATFLLAHKERASDTLLLPGSQRLVRIRGVRVFAGAQIAGMLVIAEPATSRRAGAAGEPAGSGLLPLGVPTLFGSLEPLAGGRSPAWVRACGELREALDRQTPVLLIGEAGVGKFTLATQLFRSVYPGARIVTVDAGQGATDGPDSPLPDESDQPTLYVARNIDQADAEGIGTLDEYFAQVESLDSPSWRVATVSHDPAGSPPALGALLGHFDAAITVPPLRYRTDDLPGITAALLRGIAAERRVRLSPAAHRLIGRYSWPGNISQLRDALEHALRQRQVGELTDTDLPGYCQSVSRRALTQLEAIERDAIVAALRQAGGNRVAAAAQLGMSRSSLYRKLKTYGITT